MRDSLNRIYHSANVQWEVSIADTLDIPQLEAGINDADDKILSAYSNDMSTVIDQFQNPQPDVYYMFVSPSKQGINTKTGYMPFGKKYGFLFPENTTQIAEFTRTLAHELGHGVFSMRHTFSPSTRYPLPEGTTDNLMDYNSKLLTHNS